MITWTIGLIISNGPQDTTVCMNIVAACDCGFSGASPHHVFPEWRIIYRSDTGSVISNLLLIVKTIYMDQ